jgi:metabolite-proton symporter
MTSIATEFESTAKPARASTARVLFASLIGTAIEFYDFYIYGTAASLVFGPLFFPAGSQSLQQLSAYASFGVAFIARPVGAVFFGHYGDRIGRKSTLVASLMIMGGSTTLIAFLPTYASAGWVAPLLLCVMRFGQGFGLGGEWGGATLLAVENAPPGKRARFGMFPQLGAPVGFIASNGLFLLLGIVLTHEQFLAWGWRIPFLLSILLVSLGLWVRLKLTETPAFAAAVAEAAPPKVPLMEVLMRYPREMIAGTFAVVVCFAIFYLATVFALGYGTGTLHYPRSQFIEVQLAAILFLAVGILLAGTLADRFHPRAVLIAGSLGVILVGFLLDPLFGSGSLGLVFVFLALSLALMGVTYGPIGAWLPSLFPARVRYTGASMAFNLGGIVGGALAPVLAQRLADEGGLHLVGYYLTGAAVISLVALVSLKKN